LDATSWHRDYPTVKPDVCQGTIALNRDEITDFGETLGNGHRSVLQNTISTIFTGAASKTCAMTQLANFIPQNAISSISTSSTGDAGGHNAFPIFAARRPIPVWVNLVAWSPD
jgi:hypothetical protein